MTGGPDRHERRARRLLRCYPPAWRVRYGEEFTQLLVDEFAERPRSPRRTVDVVLSGGLARLARAGLAGDMLDAQGQMRASLALLAGALSAFLVLGIAIWSQLTIGWQWSPPSSAATRTAMLLMSAAIVAFAALAIFAAVPLVWSLGRSPDCGRGRVLASAGIVAGLAVLILGSVHFGHGWPGTGGHPWPGRDVVPSVVARFCWAATLWMTSYWAHPGRLAGFPISELVWMLVSPAALLAVLIGATRLLRALPLSPKLMRYELRVGVAATLVMAVLLAGASSWVVTGGAAPRGLFRVGAIDTAGVAAMFAALTLGFRAVRRGLTADIPVTA